MGTDLAGFLGNLTGGGMLLAEEQEGVDFFIHEWSSDKHHLPKR